MVKQFSSIEEIHDKVEIRISLERVVQLDDKGAIHMLQYVALG